MKYITILVLTASVSALTGCTTAMEKSDKLLKPLLKGADKYCLELPTGTRMQIRQEQIPSLIKEMELQNIKAIIFDCGD